MSISHLLLCSNLLRPFDSQMYCIGESEATISQSVAVWQSCLRRGAIAVCDKSLRDIDTIVEL